MNTHRDEIQLKQIYDFFLSAIKQIYDICFFMFKSD